MSNGDQTQQPDVLLMAEVANYSGFPSNSDDNDWNWTQTEPSLVTAARSTGFQVAIVVILSFLVVAGMLLNLVTVVTHLQSRPQTDYRNGQQRATSDTPGSVADRCSRDAPADTVDCVARQHPRSEPCLLRSSPIDRVRAAAPTQRHLKTMAVRSARMQMVPGDVHPLWNSFAQHGYSNRNRQASRRIRETC